MSYEDFSDKIRQCKDGAASNPYQGTDKKVLFVCSMGILRSATAARMYAHKYNTRSAGTYGEALIPLTPMLLAWADQVVFVNRENFEQAKQDFGVNNLGSYTVLNIPDKYEHMHPELQAAFKEQYDSND